MGQDVHDSLRHELGLIREIPDPLPALTPVWILQLYQLVIIDLLGVKDRIGMALNNSPFGKGLVALGVLGRACCQQVAIFLAIHDLSPQPIGVGLVVLQNDFEGEASCEFCQDPMAFALDDVVVALVEFCISLFEECGPKLHWVLAPAEHPLILGVDGHLVIDDDVELLRELEESDHVGALAIGPPGIPIAVVADRFLDESLP